MLKNNLLIYDESKISLLQLLIDHNFDIKNDIIIEYISKI